MSHYLDLFRFCPVCGSSQFAEHNEKSKHCNSCGFTYYFNMSCSIAMLIHNERGELLTAIRAKEPKKGMLDLVGGFVDPQENLETAARREVMEETGLDLSGVPLRYVCSEPNTYLYSGLLVHTCDVYFDALVPSAAALQADDDVASLRWMRLEDIKLEDVAFDSSRRVLERLKNNAL